MFGEQQVRSSTTWQTQQLTRRLCTFVDCCDVGCVLFMQGKNSVLWGELGVLDALNIILESLQRLGELGPGMLRLGRTVQHMEAGEADEGGVSVHSGNSEAAEQS